MRVLLLVIIIVIIVFLVYSCEYFYKYYSLSGKKKQQNIRSPIVRHEGHLDVRRYQQAPPLATATVSLKGHSLGATLDYSDGSDSDDDDDIDYHQEELGGRYNNFVRQRERARKAGFFSDDPDGSIFTKTSTEIINDRVDDEAGTFGVLYRSEKALALKDHISGMAVEDNDIYTEMMSPDNEILATVGMENYNDGQGERSMMARTNDENNKVIQAEIFSRIQHREGMAIEGVTDRDFSQMQVVPQSMVGGRPPASATLKKLAYESTSPDVQAFMSSLAAKDIEIRKEIAGNSNNSMVDQPFIASDFIQ